MSKRCNIEPNNSICRLEEIQQALKDRNFQRLLHGTTGAFSIRYLFLDGYLNYIHHLRTDPSFNPSIYYSKRLGFRGIWKQLEKMLLNKDVPPVDILFISRNRQVRVKTQSGYLTGDYIFYSIINELQTKYPHIRLQTFISDDFYNQYYQASFLDLFKSVYISIRKSLCWRYYQKSISRRLRKQECTAVISSAAHFFQPRFILRHSLKGYSMKRVLERAQPKVIVSNDDCIYTRPLIKIPAKCIVLQSARMAEHLEMCRKIVFQEEGLKPDYFMASGDYFRDLKEKGEAAEKVVVTGLPRYDLLGYASHIYSRSDFAERYRIDPKNKIVAWFTACHAYTEEEIAANLIAVFETLKKLDEVTLVIKQHPAEAPKYAEMLKKTSKSIMPTQY